MNSITTMSQKERIFLDSRVIIGLFAADNNSEQIFNKILDKTLCINDIVFSEVSYKAMVLKFLDKEDNFSLKKIKSGIADYVYLYRVVLKFIAEFGIELLAISGEVIEIASEIARKYYLLPNDALIAATCKHYGISKIATLDPDFKELEFLEIVTI